MIWTRVMTFGERVNGFEFDRNTLDVEEDTLPIFVSDNVVAYTYARWEPDGVYIRRPPGIFGLDNFIPRGVGRIDENDYVWNYRLTGFYATVKNSNITRDSDL